MRLLLVCLLLTGCAAPFAQGVAFQSRGAVDDARAAYSAAGDHPGALYNLALLEEARAPARAMDLYREALERDPRLVGAHLNGARLWVEAGEPDSARAWVARAQRACPDHPEPWLASARLAFVAGELEAARAAVADALLRQPDHPGALALELSLCPPEQRVEVAERLTRASSGKPSAEALTGRALRAVGLLQAALTHLEHAVLGDPEDGPLLLELGLCLRELGRPRDALLALWRAEALRVDDPRLGEALRASYRELLRE